MSFEYNARGERVRKYKGSTTQARYVYNEAGQLLVEQTISGSTTTTSEIVWLDNLPVGVIRNNILHYIEPDHLGTPRQVIDRTRDVAVWRWDLLNDPFGESAPNTNPDADGTHFVFNMRFPGQLFDAESGLNYNYFRDYEPGTGRYVESDPIGVAEDAATYAYVSSNPLVYFDALGLARCHLNSRQICCLAKEFGVPSAAITRIAIIPKSLRAKVGSSVDGMITGAKAQKGEFATTRTGRIFLDGECDPFVTDDGSADYWQLHEFYHVLKQWDHGMTRRKYLTNPGPWESAANAFAKTHLASYRACLSASGCGCL